MTVSLSGDGGDEMFGGYHRYVLAERWWRRLARVPRPLRRAAARGVLAVSPGQWDRALGAAGMNRLSMRPTGDRLHKFAEAMGVEALEGVYLQLVSHWQAPADVVRGGEEPPTRLTGGRNELPEAGAVPRLMYLDLLTYLPDDIMVKVDRATMGVSLESRAPYLDHTVVDFAWRLPMEYKVSGGRGKRILRELLYRYVPQPLVERPKMGFGVPIDRWLRGPLKEWAGDLLSPERIRRDGYLDPDVITRKWDEHQSGSRNWQYLLWDVLMFQAWLQS